MARGDETRGEARRRRGHARCRRATRKYARRRPLLIRQPGRRRAVSGRANDRRLSPTAFACRRCTRQGARSRGTRAARFVAFVANSPGASCRVNYLRHSDTLLFPVHPFQEAIPMARKTVLVCDNCGREVGEGKGATLAPELHRRAARLEAGRPLRQLRERDAGPRSGEAGPPAKVRSRREVNAGGRSPAFDARSALGLSAVRETSDRRSTIGRWPRGRA